MIDREDYEEPNCPFCTDAYEKKPVSKIPTDRIARKADAFFGKNDYGSAEKLYLFWLGEAKDGNDAGGEFFIRNELMGLYRKTGRKDEAIFCAEEALRLAAASGSENTLSAATAYINIGTVFKAFGMPEKALPHFEKAERIYRENLRGDDARLGGLYNNYALALADIKRYAEAREKYRKAVSVMKKIENGEPETAITLLNLADLAEREYGAENGAEEIERCVKEAEKLILSPSVPKDGNYAFVCEKCAPVFGYYGFFATQRELEETAKRIYDERS